jgi:hypothetical protein
MKLIRNEVGLEWRMYGRQERHTKGFDGEPEGKKQHRKSWNRWMILKWILEK